MQFLVYLFFLLAHCAYVNSSVDLFLEGLLWYTSETTDWAFTLQSSEGLTKTDYKAFSFEWAPGIRGGLKYHTDDSPFDLQLYYTGISSCSKEKTTGPVTPAFMASRLSFLEPFDTGKAKLNIDYNMFDCELGILLQGTQSLSIRPAIGIKAGWIDQKIHSYWERTLFTIPIKAKENLHQHFGGIGPKGAVTLNWNLGTSLTLISLVDVSYLWGYWTIKDRFLDNLDTVIDVNTDDRNFGSLVVHTFLGIEWECQLLPIKIKLGYEIETWFNELQIFTDDSGSQSNNLVFQGISLGFDKAF